MRPECLATEGFGLSSLPADSPIIFHSAKLEGWSMYHVEKEYYPGIIPVEKAKQVELRFLNGSSTVGVNPEGAVNGKLVYNLTKQNMQMLDEYEGDEYECRELEVFDLEKNEYVKAWCYIWIDSVDRLVKYDGRKY